MREKVVVKNQEKNLVDYTEQMFHQQHQGYALKLKNKRTIKYLKRKLLKVTLLLLRNNYLNSLYLANYKSILVIQNRTLSSFPFLPLLLITKIKQVIS